MFNDRKLIRCCGCDDIVSARLTNGAEIYPHRADLADLPFWKCDACLNYVGCHHKTSNRTAPLGCIPTKELMAARREIHKILDPLWQSGNFSRRGIYADLSKALGWTYHTAKITSVGEANQVIAHLNSIAYEVA